MAEDAGARLLLTCDSDTFPIPPEGGLGAMWRTMTETVAAVVGAAVDHAQRQADELRASAAGRGVRRRGRDRLHADRPVEAARSAASRGSCIADSADGLGVVCGEDIYFCRHAKAAGHRVVVDFTLPMGHADQSIQSTGRVALPRRR
jgi:hypothetical protein